MTLDLGSGLFVDVSYVGLAMALAGCLALYFLPTIIALVRKHHNSVAIGVLNLVAGWTFIGWVVALVWSCMNVGTRAGAGPAHG